MTKHALVLTMVMGCALDGEPEPTAALRTQHVTTVPSPTKSLRQRSTNVASAMVIEDLMSGPGFPDHFRGAR